MDSVGHVPPPPDFIEYARQLRLRYRNYRDHGYEGLSVNSIRKLPYAYWLKGEPTLASIEPDLVARYWNGALPSALVSGPRRAKRWLLPLVHTYCEHFSPEEYEFVAYASRVGSNINRGQGEFVSVLMNLQREVSFFSPSAVADRIAAVILRSGIQINQVLAERALWPGFLDTRLGLAAFESALIQGQRTAPDSSAFFRLIEWSRLLTTPVAKSSIRVAFANCMLLPWVRFNPDEKLKLTLMNTFDKYYGSPRELESKYYNWRGVERDAISLMRNWLTGETLRTFIEVLRRTADRIWRFREKFWMAYYEAGYIQEAWLALGTESTMYAEELRSRGRDLRYGRLEGSVQTNQSVLFLKMGSLVFSEWSHDGSLRVHKEDDRNAPTLYQGKYIGSELRAIGSLDFHGGLNKDPQLKHMASDHGTWQRKARDLIRRHTGIFLSDSAIL
jgi:hypothetical protein